MMFSPGIPILYLTSFIHLTALCWIDKIWVLKICTSSKNFDSSMESYVRDVLSFVPLVHSLFAIFIFGNNSIFMTSENEEDLNLNSNA